MHTMRHRLFPAQTSMTGIIPDGTKDRWFQHIINRVKQLSGCTQHANATDGSKCSTQFKTQWNTASNDS